MRKNIFATVIPHEQLRKNKDKVSEQVPQVIGKTTEENKLNKIDYRIHSPSRKSRVWTKITDSYKNERHTYSFGHIQFLIGKFSFYSVKI